ncbi:MAG: SCO family protein, partial [Wenzhouxiangellaceae bacterium]
KYPDTPVTRPANAGGNIMLIVIVVLISILAGVILARQWLSPAAEFEAASIYPEARIISDFSLRDADGREFSQADLSGSISLLFFGFTHCPDICPDTLAVLARAREKLETMRVEQLPEVIFVSVDPERDGGATMREYVEYFHPAFRAVTGDDQALERLTSQVGAMYVLGVPDEQGFYSVDHSGMVVIIDSGGRMIGRFRTGVDADSMAADLFRLIRAGV